MTKLWNAREIHAQLDAFRAADPGLEWFGARRHRYQLGPTLAESEVAAFESEHHVRLPDEYRTFLLEVGNGGAGPDYGLFRLDGTDMENRDREERLLPGHLSAAFPHTERWDPDVAPPDRNPPPPGEMAENEYFDDKWITGSLIIAEIGCGKFYRLIVTGSARGQVWDDCRCSDGGLTPQGTFREWYDGWLNHGK